MKALTIWQPWASLIILGLKPYEFRRWPAPRHVRGRTIIIHAAMRPVRYGEVAQIIEDLTRHPDTQGMKVGPALDLLEDWCRRHAASRAHVFPLRAGLGTSTLGDPVRCTELYKGEAGIDESMWAWPVSDVTQWREPLPANGAQGFWDWKARP